MWNIDFIFDLTNFASSFVVFDGVVKKVRMLYFNGSANSANNI